MKTDGKYDSIHGRMEVVTDIDRLSSFAVTRSGPACYYRAESPRIVGRELVAASWRGPFMTPSVAFAGGIK